MTTVQLQVYLKNAGFYLGKIDGLKGSKTLKAEKNAMLSLTITRLLSRMDIEKPEVNATVSELEAKCVEGIKYVLSYYKIHPDFRNDFGSYILATFKHETAGTFKPLSEYGGEYKFYAPFYGRGHIQLTHRFNYQMVNILLAWKGYDFVKNPDLFRKTFMLSLIYSIFGMMEGIYTGVGLPRYINSKQVNFVKARKVVNGLDKSRHIANIAIKYKKAKMFD